MYYYQMADRKQWTTEERHLLKKYYNKISLSDLLDKLPSRSRSSVYSQVNYLKKRGWTFNPRKINE